MRDTVAVAFFDEMEKVALPILGGLAAPLIGGAVRLLGAGAVRSGLRVAGQTALTSAAKASVKPKAPQLPNPTTGRDIGAPSTPLYA